MWVFTKMFIVIWESKTNLKNLEAFENFAIFLLLLKYFSIFLNFEKEQFYLLLSYRGRSLLNVTCYKNKLRRPRTFRFELGCSVMGTLLIAILLSLVSDDSGASEPLRQNCLRKIHTKTGMLL